MEYNQEVEIRMDEFEQINAILSAPNLQEADKIDNGAFANAVIVEETFKNGASVKVEICRGKYVYYEEITLKEKEVDYIYHIDDEFEEELELETAQNSYVLRFVVQ